MSEIWERVRWMIIGWERVDYWLLYLTWIAAILGGVALGWAIQVLYVVLKEKKG